jgi:hemerythrin-like metal-binding protein
VTLKHLTLSDDLLLGHAQLDAEHAKLVGLVNECIDIVAADSGRDVVESKVTEICDFLRLHIEHEEQIMAQLDYKIAENEKRHHNEGMAKFSSLRDQFKAGMAAADVVQELKHLILVTFLRTDMGLKSYLLQIRTVRQG